MMQRGFVKCGGRYTHWRAMGSGPVVVMLHESPRSSTSLIPLMEALSEQFYCIALDTPGYGASDPLPERFAPIEAFADETLKALSLLGIETFQLYGTHTGAAIACEIGRRAPDRTHSLLLDGLALFTPEEQGPLLEKYLLPQEPAWDGSHLMRIWSRIRDQALFFPFYDRSPAARLDVPNTDLGFMLRSAIGFIEAGDHYRDGYQAALTYDARARAETLAMPGRVHAIEGDLISSHLPRAGGTALDVITAPLPQSQWLTETR
ncbi:MAG: alpha/beta hydrolase, partial [Pseudomonadota bacterium]